MTNWVKDKINEIGMQRILQDLIDELNTEEDYVILLKQDLQKTLENYQKRHQEEEFTSD